MKTLLIDSDAGRFARDMVKLRKQGWRTVGRIEVQVIGCEIVYSQLFEKV